MSDDTDTERATTDPGRELGQDTSELSPILGDAYRGELDRETTWRSRLDQTTTWSVTLMAAILTWAFSSPDNPHYIVLVGVLTVGLFCWIESRRYRDYDVYRSRVRLFQQDLFANALDPSLDVEHREWRTELGEDYRHPTYKITMFEAVSNRLRRIYFALLLVLGLAWLFRVTAFVPDASLPAAAAVGTVSGVVVLAVVGAFYATLFAVMLWPHEREAKGEFRDVEAGEWKDAE
ncbi:DUF2270 domain-containing protein [Natronolimnohabitans innermongolicus]|uniref:DUF2270 domain-containing protein n=1 Tax=Natronolimnohabitans innermongolicus JCM 12255 TaxID=1227499 RepID=L9WL29_9EURY|nr:DUF2270 domain-containing protein [Natronolimnohabitans innermongolicus]ELY50205.1 hypothetical protein C493_19601 [Natronolimnohabitans innermongolicus JCM 12255]